jgi:hypothetical protein
MFICFCFKKQQNGYVPGDWPSPTTVASDMTDHYWISFLQMESYASRHLDVDLSDGEQVRRRFVKYYLWLQTIVSS